MTRSNRPKVAILTNFVSPYRLPVFEEVAKHTQLRVFVNAQSEFDRSWPRLESPLDIVQPRSLALRRRTRTHGPVPFDQTQTIHLPLGLISALKDFDPDVVISGELGPRSALAAWYCRRARKRLVLWSYQSEISSHQSLLKRWVHSRLLKRADAVIGMGHAARKVLRRWGVEERRIFDAPNASAKTFFETTERPEHRSADRKRTALVVGRLVPLKGIPQLLDAWKRVPESIRDHWTLAFLGEGPHSPLIDEASRDGVVQLPHGSPEEVKRWYGRADLHIFSSLGDVWGLVVNEAMNQGVPTLCSIWAGCCEDLIEDGSTGFTFDPTNPASAAEKITHVLSRTDLEVIGEQGRQRARALTPRRMATGFLQAIDENSPRTKKVTSLPSPELDKRCPSSCREESWSKASAGSMR